MELRDLAALHSDGADAGDAVERRFELVGGELPELGLRELIGGEAVAEDGEGGEGEAVGGDDGGGGKSLTDTAESGIDQLQRAEHVDAPVEEEAYLRRASAGGGAYGDQAGNGVYGVLDGLGDGHLHLLDRHDTVVDADDDAGKVGLRKDGDRNLLRRVDPGQREHDKEEEDGAAISAASQKGRSLTGTGSSLTS